MTSPVCANMNIQSKKRKKKKSLLDEREDKREGKRKVTKPRGDASFRVLG